MGALQRNDFSIPRKSLNKTDTSHHHISDVALNSEPFRNIYQQVILSHLSNSCQDRESLRIIRCRIISNKQLETRFFNFRRSLESQRLPADVSFGYTLLSDNVREMELIAQWGLSVNNNFVGDLGEPAHGVYLSAHPDLVTPAPFLSRTKLKILACKVLKGRTSIVGLGSYHLLPKRGYHSHAAMQSVDCKLSRHDNFRCDQIFLFEEKGDGYSKSPGNVLPFAIYDVEFSPNAVLSFKGTDSVVWSGNLSVGNRRYNRVSLYSLAAATKPPLLDTFEVTDLIHWTACLAFPPILELLKPPSLGEIALKKEVLLNDSQRLVYHFTLFSEGDSHDFVLLHESMRIKQAAGITIFPSVGIFILLPNGLFSDLLMLPKANGIVLHCLYLTCDLNSSLINGAFEAMSTEENDEFMRPLLLQERIDGLDVHVQELVRNVAKKASLFEENSNKVKGENSNASSEAVDMEIADSDDDDDHKRDWRVECMNTRSGIKKLSKEHLISTSNSTIKPSSPHSTGETVSTDKWVHSSNSGGDKVVVARDPRKRLIISQDLSTPSCPVVELRSSERSDIVKKPIPSLFNLPATNFRDYSPSDAISSGRSSPKIVSQSQRSPTSSSPIVRDSGSTAFVGNLKNKSELDNTESPASPPHETGVFVATAPKIISDYDMRSAADASFQTLTRQYRPPEVTPFTALASTNAMEIPTRSNDKKPAIPVEIKHDCEESRSPPASQINENVFGDESTYIQRELTSFPCHSIPRNPVASGKTDSLLNAPQQLRWNIVSNAKAGDGDLSFWKTNRELVGGGDVDMRNIHAVSSVPNTSRDVTASTSHHLTPAVQAPIVFSNGDTDHRVISSAILPSTSVQPPESFTNESAGHSRFNRFCSYNPLPSLRPFQYRIVSSTSHLTRFKQPRVYGFFNQPTVHHQQKPYFSRDTVSESRSVILERRGVLMIDDAQLTNGTLDPKFFRMILERFSNWRKSGTNVWWVKLHTYTRQILRLDSASSDFNSKIVEIHANYEETIKKYENLKVVQTMKPHECDKNKHDANALLKCLSHTANANRKCTMIYLTDIAKDSSMGVQIACTGFEIYCSAELSKKFDI